MLRKVNIISRRKKENVNFLTHKEEFVYVVFKIADGGYQIAMAFGFHWKL